MPFTWLWDSANNKWHIWNTATPVNGDTAYCGHSKTDADLPSGDDSTVPTKCSTCVSDGIAAGLPID